MIKTWKFLIVALLFFQNLEAQEVKTQNQSQVKSDTNTSIVSISPFQFVMDEKNVQIESPQIKYLIQNDSIQVGTLNINKNDFKIVLKKASNLQISNETNLSKQENTEILEVELTNTNIDLTSFEILDKTGQRIYQSSIQQGKMSFIDPKKSMTAIFQSETFFRLCFISSSENDELRICSSNMTFDKESFDFKLTQQNEQAKNRIYFNNNEITELNSSFTPSKTDKLSVHFENKAGLTLTYTGQLPLLNFTEFTRSLDKLNITGIGLRPLEIKIKEIKNEVHPMMQQTFNQKFYFENPETWYGETQLQDHVNFHFQKGVYSIFTTKASFTHLPFDKDKPSVRNNTPFVTYQNFTKRDIILSENTSIANLSENQLSSSSNLSTIEIKQDTIFELTTNTIQLTDSNHQVRSLKYDSIQGTNTELSVRLTSASGGNKATYLGELKSDYWFESIPLLNNQQYSLLRLGISAKYYQNVSEMSYIQKNNQTETEIETQMRLFYLDFKYRLKPGIWNRDETTGPILSYQQADITNTQFNLIGLGFFWARSMPHLFNVIMNYLPFMKYPKYVDLDFVYYFNTTSKDIQLLNNWALNFHGKVMWTKQFFGEAGFGFKTYSILNKAQNNIALSSFYGTAGLGWQF